MARPNRSKRRKAVRSFVQSRDLQGLSEWARREPDAVLMVVALIFEKDTVMRHHAFEALGELTAQLAAEDEVEKVRGVIRRLLWLMNDESGGIAWHGPEAIAEILERVPELLDEYGRIVASFIDEPPFGPGVHRAVAKLAPMNSSEFGHVRDRFLSSIDSPDPVERAYGLLALSALLPKKAKKAAAKLVDDPGEITEYDSTSDSLQTFTVAEVARQVMGRPARAA